MKNHRAKIIVQNSQQPCRKNTTDIELRLLLQHARAVMFRGKTITQSVYTPPWYWPYGLFPYHRRVSLTHQVEVTSLVSKIPGDF